MMRMDDEFGISNKAGDVSKEGDSRKSDDGGGGGTTIESNLFPKKKMMMMVHDHDHHNCPFTSEDNGWRGGGGGDVVGGGPTCNNDSRPKTTSSSGDVIGGGVSAAAAVKILQPFDIGAAVPQTSFKSPGEFMAAPSMGFPFTNAQWKELERQAMIYKYMMASLPVPPQLLFPFLRNPSLPSSPPLVGGGLNLIRFSNGGDLEPGRCRRTDGKKWRCSRDVAPDQKYCERHLHRGRHRSRKPVELPPKNSNNKKTRLESNPPPPSTLQFPSNNTKVTQLCNYVKSTEKVSAFESLERQRCLDWMMKGEQWQDGSVYDQNSNSYANFSSGKDSVFINQDLVVSLENQNQTETPIRGFIDAWSHHHHHNNTSSGNSSSNGNLSLSPLSLSMGGSSSSNTTTPTDDEMGWVQMGLGVIQTGHQDREYSTKLPFSNWLPPASWAPSTPGGPLAEVLRPSTVIPSNPPSPAAINGDSNSPQATTLSSPSGVLQKTLAASSWSDSSGSSSPTLASSNANKKPVELALLWLNQGKLASST